jgi:hypothetical protein
MLEVFRYTNGFHRNILGSVHVTQQVHQPDRWQEEEIDLPDQLLLLQSKLLRGATELLDKLLVILDIDGRRDLSHLDQNCYINEAKANKVYEWGVWEEFDETSSTDNKKLELRENTGVYISKCVEVRRQSLGLEVIHYESCERARL